MVHLLKKQGSEVMVATQTGETSEPGLLPRAVSGSMYLSQSGSVLMPMIHVATKAWGILLTSEFMLVSEGHADARSLHI